MKRAEILPTLEKLLADPPFTIATMYKICWLNGALNIISASCPLQPEIVFQVLHKSTLQEGLTSKQWDTLEDKVVIFLTQKGLI